MAKYGNMLSEDVSRGLNEWGRNFWAQFGIGSGARRGGPSNIPEAPDISGAIAEAQPGIRQQRTSEEEERLRIGRLHAERAGDISENVRGNVADMEARANLLEGKVERVHGEAGDAIEAAGITAAAIPGNVRREVDAAKQDFASFAGKGIAEISGRADAVMADVAKGQGAAMQAATLGIQGNIRNTVAQINSNPNIPPAQKAQLITQARMQGAMALAPAVGATILDFNRLRSETAVAMTSQITSAITQSTATYGALAQTGVSEVAGAFTASAQIGVALAGMSVTEGNQYISNQAMLDNQRFQAEMRGDEFQLALLADRDEPVPNFSSISFDDLLMTVEGMRIEFMAESQRYGMSMSEYARQRAEADAGLNNIISLFGMFV